MHSGAPVGCAAWLRATPYAAVGGTRHRSLAASVTWLARSPPRLTRANVPAFACASTAAHGRDSPSKQCRRATDSALHPVSQAG